MEISVFRKGGVMETFVEKAKSVRLEISFMPISCLVDAVPVYFLWNWLGPKLSELPEITFWQAWGLCFLLGTLMRGFAQFAVRK